MRLSAPSPAGGAEAPSRRARPAHYALAVVTVAAAWAAWWGLRALVGPDVPLTVFTLAVVATAWAGGVGPGLLATLLSLAIAHYAPGPAGMTAAATGPVYALRFTLYGLVGVAVSVLSELRREASARAEASAHAMATSQQRFQRIVENAAEGVWEIDTEGRTTYANERTAEMLGLPRAADLVGRSAFDFVVPEDQERARAEWQQRMAGDRGAMEVRLQRTDAARRWFHLTAAPVREPDGQVSGAFAMLTDVTEARESAEALRRAAARHAAELDVLRVMAEAATREEAYPRLLKAICEGLGWDVGAVWFVDDQANQLRCAAVWRRDEMADAEFVSATLRQPVGPGEGLPGRVWISAEPAWLRDVQDDPQRPRFPQTVAAGLHSAFAFPITLGSRCVGVMEFFSREIRDEEPDLVDGMAPLGGQVAQFVVRKSGEEERAQLLARERTARQEAEEANRAKDQFLSTLSHELRTPLNAIVGWAHLLKTGQLDDKNVERAVEVIDRNARSQSQIISDVLDVSRIVTGRLRLEVRRVNARTLVEEAISSIEAAAKAKGLRVEAQLEGTEAPVSADPDRLRQIVWNLLSNAVKFTPEGGTIGLTLKRLPSAVEIVVSDTGAGIDREFLPHVFERFRQRDSSSTRVHGGLGLGLALVRHLVELHGGTVTAESEGAGKGSRFTVRLPLSVTEAERADEDAGEAVRPEPVNTAEDAGRPPTPPSANGFRWRAD